MSLRSKGFFADCGIYFLYMKSNGSYLEYFDKSQMATTWPSDVFVVGIDTDS